MQKLLNILFILIALIILFISLKSYVHEYPNKQEDTILHKERVGVVEERKAKESNSGDTTDETRPNSFKPRTAKTSWYGKETEITAYIQEVFKESSNWGLRLCLCEPECRPDAYNPAGPYIGLFQFSHSTFNNNCTGSIWEWKDQVVCAKKLVDKGEALWRWPSCP